VATSQDAKPGVVSRPTSRIIAQALACGLAVCVTVGSAIIAKEFSSSAMPLAAVDTLNLNGERVNPAVEIVPVSTNVAEEPATAEEADGAALPSEDDVVADAAIASTNATSAAPITAALRRKRAMTLLPM